jgi:hypothetical protein
VGSREITFYESTGILTSGTPIAKKNEPRGARRITKEMRGALPSRDFVFLRGLLLFRRQVRQRAQDALGTAGRRVALLFLALLFSTQSVD